MAVTAASAMGMIGAPSALAAYVWTPVAAVGVTPGNGTVFVDFADDSPLVPMPYHGYVYVRRDGTVSCHAQGGPAAGPSGSNPTFSDDGRCDPLH